MVIKKDKINDYELTGSIHTLSIKSPGMVEYVPPEIKPCIKPQSVETKTGDVITRSIINPNKLEGDLYSFSDFDMAFQTILTECGIADDYSIIRADMRFDNFSDDNYLKFAKLNRYLISMVAVTYQSQNCYRTCDLFTHEQLSVAIKNRAFELENYDKFAESHGTDPAKNRLEERSLRWKNNDLKKEFTEHWFWRWDKALNHRKLVERKYNEALVKLYEQRKDAFPVQFRKLTDFIIQYQGSIFTKRQLVDLFGRLGIPNAERRASYHKTRYGIEFISLQECKQAIAEIKRATNQFFDT